ncbi:MAG: phosphatase PAP2 family protein [Pirellulales bacterium]
MKNPSPFTAQSLAASLFAAGLLVLTGFSALAIDLPAAHWLAGHSMPRDVLKLLTLSESFAHGYGVAVILLAVALLDADRRRLIPWIAGASLGAGLTADVLKLVVSRMRPHAFDLQGDVLATFVGWFRLVDRSSQWQSFPSAHTATAVGLALGLSWLYPRGRPLFAALAVLAAAQRVTSQSHFVSDVLWGAAVGVAVSSLCVWGAARNAAVCAKKNRASHEARLNPNRSSPLGGTGRTPECDESLWPFTGIPITGIVEGQSVINDES